MNGNCNCYPFTPAGCGSMNYGNYQGPAGPFTCRPHFPAIRSDFIIPPAGVPVVIETTDTESLNQGMGIMIDGGFYQITNIINSLQIEARTNGLGAASGARIIAVHPTARCFQHLVIPVGKVSLDTTPSLVGLDNPQSGAVANSITSVSLARLVYGYLGPTTIQVNGEFDIEVLNAPYWIGVAMPVPIRAMRHSLSAYIRYGSDPFPAVAKIGAAPYENHIVIGPGSAQQWSDGVSRIGVFAGTFEILI